MERTGDVDMKRRTRSSIARNVVVTIFISSALALLSGAKITNSTGFAMVGVAEAQDTQSESPVPVQEKHNKRRHQTTQTSSTNSSCTESVNGMPSDCAYSDAQQSPAPWWGQLILYAIGVYLFLPAILLALIPRWFRSNQKSTPRIGRDGHAIAEYDIPHCQYEATQNGFKVSFCKLPLSLERFVSSNHRNPKALLALCVMSAFFLQLPVLFILIYTIHARRNPTVIEITPELVIIRGTKYKRTDFGGFYVEQTLDGGKKQGERDTGNRALLGFTHGARRYPLAGVWHSDEATEFVSSLNNHLRATPRSGDTHQPAPEQLRAAAQPSEF